MRPDAKAPDWFRPTFRTQGNILICEGDAWDSKGEVCTFQLAAPVGDKYPEQVANKENLRRSCWEAVWLIAQDRSPFEFGGQHQSPPTQDPKHFCAKHGISFIANCALCAAELNEARPQYEWKAMSEWIAENAPSQGEVFDKTPEDDGWEIEGGALRRPIKAGRPLG